MNRYLLMSIALALPLLAPMGCTSRTEGGSVNVHLVDGPIAGFKEINLNIQRLEISGPDGWVLLASPNKTVNLLSLVGGVSETLAKGQTLAAGRYAQMRLILGEGNTLRLSDDTLQELTTPSALKSGVKINVSFEVAQGTTKDVFIDFDARHSIQVTQTGASAKYILRPTVRGYDKLMTGSISGTFSGGNGAPLADAVVTAQALPSGGGTDAAVIRTVKTNSSGSYTLDLLPLGATYYVVSQPQVGSTSYVGKVSEGYALTSASPVLTYNAAFTAAAEVGSVSGSLAIPAAADQHDVVELLEEHEAAGVTASFVMQSLLPAIENGLESFAFSNIPAGSANHHVRAWRYTLASDGSMGTPLQTNSDTFTVGAGSTVNLPALAF